jgi:hypothetical protein
LTGSLLTDKKRWIDTVLISPPQSPAGLTGFLRIPGDSSGFLRIPAGLHYNFADFKLEEKISVKSSGFLRTT